MPIQFTPDRWEKVKEDYTAWWNKSLKRPIIKATIGEAFAPGRPCPQAPILTQQTCADLSISPEDIVDRLDYELSGRKFLGDAFPFISFDTFGPGVLAAMCGARLDNSSGGVWFHSPNENMPIDQLHIEADMNNIWLSRIKDIYGAGLKKWQGNVLMGMPDLGGVLDVLATFRGSENLLMDLYDYPEEVKRLTKEIFQQWHTVYNELNSVLQPINPGYSDWSGVYSAQPSYILQCDFCYMIGNPMFREFVLETLIDDTTAIDNTIFHLDGPGEVQHLDDILKIEKLDAVQWVPGTGNPSSKEWPQIFDKIRSNGKNIYLVGRFEDMDAICERIGTQGVFHMLYLSAFENEKEIIKYLEKYEITT